MSLGIIIKAPEGLVLAAESRITLTTQTQQKAAQTGLVIVEKNNVNYDNANKLLSFNQPFDRYGVVTYGLGSIGLRTAQSLLPEFETSLAGKTKLSVSEFAKSLSDFFMEQWKLANIVNHKGSGMIFNVAGFDDNEPYGTIYQFEIPGKPNPIEQNKKVNNQHQFGITAGGQYEIMSRLMMGYDHRIFNILTEKGILTQEAVSKQILPLLEPIKLQAPIQFMPLQDCVNLATILIKTTIDLQGLSMGLRGCGGAIDVAIITKNKPLTFIQKKDITVT
jgi:hypothetical protein